MYKQADKEQAKHLDYNTQLQRIPQKHIYTPNKSANNHFVVMSLGLVFQNLK